MLPKKKKKNWRNKKNTRKKTREASYITRAKAHEISIPVRLRVNHLPKKNLSAIDKNLFLCVFS